MAAMWGDRLLSSSENKFVLISLEGAGLGIGILGRLRLDLRPPVAEFIAPIKKVG